MDWLAVVNMILFPLGCLLVLYEADIIKDIKYAVSKKKKEKNYIIKKEEQIQKMARCIMESGIDCCSVCAYYDPEEQSRELPDDVEPCLMKRKFCESACMSGIKKHFEK